MAVRSVFSKNLFLGKVAVVTGGGTGIGRAITSELAYLGCKVIIASRKMEKLETAAEEINHNVSASVKQANNEVIERVFPFECNIRNEDEVSIVYMTSHTFNYYVLLHLKGCGLSA